MTRRFIIRNDDVGVDMDAKFLEDFCARCDRYPFIRLLHAITPRGMVQVVDAKWDNKTIRAMSGKQEFSANTELLALLRSRQEHGDLFGVHGLWHTHRPSPQEYLDAAKLVRAAGLTPTYVVPPFNEGDYSGIIGGMALLQSCPRLEEYHHASPEAYRAVWTEGAAYLHAWRYMPGRFFELDDLDRALRGLELAR